MDRVLVLRAGTFSRRPIGSAATSGSVWQGRRNYIFGIIETLKVKAPRLFSESLSFILKLFIGCQLVIQTETYKSKYLGNLDQRLSFFCFSKCLADTIELLH